MDDESGESLSECEHIEFEARRPSSNSRLVSVKEIGKQLRLRLGMLRDQVLGAVCNYKLITRRFWSIVSLAVLLSVLYAMLWRPRVLHRRDDKERLLLLLREKDEKISQLLVQIALMNEALRARRRVTVVRAG